MQRHARLDVSTTTMAVSTSIPIAMAGLEQHEVGAEMRLLHQPEGRKRRRQQDGGHDVAGLR